MAHGTVIQGFFPGGPRIPALPAPVPPRATVPPAVQPRQVAQPMVAQPQRAHPTGPVVQRVGTGEALRLPAHLSNLGTPGGGQALPGPVRQKMESFFNTSFADVRVHVGAQASVVGSWWTKKQGGLMLDYQETKDGYGVWLRKSAWVLVDNATQAKLGVAQAAIDYVRPFITHGPQNQGWARAQYGDEGDVNMSAMISLVDIQWGGEGGYNANWVKPRRLGAAVAATGGGNCQG
jgi:hypothetical protein